MHMLGCSWRDVWPRYSESPAALMGLPSKLEPGHPADFCVLRVTPENKLRDLRVYANGSEQNVE